MKEINWWKFLCKIDKEYKEIQESKKRALKRRSKSHCTLLLDAQEMLRQWEAGGDSISVENNEPMGVNGFDITYKNLRRF